MHQYKPGYWGILFAFSLKGSTVLRALAWALPCTILTVIVNYVFHNHISITDKVDVKQAWYVYNWSIGFLVAFRTKTAYSRWWEGGALLQKLRGEWFNAYSSLISFCSDSNNLKEEVRSFQFSLARLMSLLYCSVLLTVCQEDDGCCFEILDLKGMSQSSLEYLWRSSDKVEIVNHWIQQLVVKNMRNEVLAIPPPVISRVFQELSRGMVHFNNLLKISEFLLPFPFAQLTTFMLLIHWLLTPFIVGLIFDGAAFAAATCFISVFALWAINYTGTEVEQPFGLDENDLPLYEMQAFLNESLMELLEEKVQGAPKFGRLDTDYRLQPVPTTAYDSTPITLRSRMADSERPSALKSRISINRGSRGSFRTNSDASYGNGMSAHSRIGTLLTDVELELAFQPYSRGISPKTTSDASVTSKESGGCHGDGASPDIVTQPRFGCDPSSELDSPSRAPHTDSPVGSNGRVKDESLYSFGILPEPNLHQDDLFFETGWKMQEEASRLKLAPTVAFDWKANFGEESMGPLRLPTGPPATGKAQFVSPTSI